MRRSVVCLGIWSLVACSGDVSDAAQGDDNEQLDAAISMPAPMAGGPSATAGSTVPGQPAAGSGSVIGGAGTAGGGGTAGAAGSAGASAGTGANAGTGGSAGGVAGSAGSAGSDPEDAGMPVDSGMPPEPDAGMAGELGPAEVRFVGRVDQSTPANARYQWSGTGMVARFMGTSIAGRFGNGQEDTVVLDGMVRPKLVPGSGTTMIASGLSNEPHVIEIYRRTEANQGETQFMGFTFGSGGMLLPNLRAPERKIEIIGDSITVGYGNEGPNKDCGFSPQTENHYQTYGAMAARELDAELSTIAWSGKGMVCNYGDDAQACTNPLPVYYERTLPDRSDSRWDFTKAQPQVVVINLGTNDFSTDTDPSETQFVNAYRDFLQRVRGKYPNALILCTIGPLLWGEELDRVRAYIASAISATGDAKIASYQMPPQSEADGLGCGYHPSIKTHQKMADLLVAELEKRLGW